MDVGCGARGLCWVHVVTCSGPWVASPRGQMVDSWKSEQSPEASQWRSWPGLALRGMLSPEEGSLRQPHGQHSSGCSCSPLRNLLVGNSSDAPAFQSHSLEERCQARPCHPRWAFQSCPRVCVGVASSAPAATALSGHTARALGNVTFSPNHSLQSLWAPTCPLSLIDTCA